MRLPGGGNCLGYLMLGTQAPGAQVESLFLTTYNDCGGMYIRHPAAVGVTLGMTDIMTELR